MSEPEPFSERLYNSLAKHQCGNKEVHDRHVVEEHGKTSQLVWPRHGGPSYYDERLYTDRWACPGIEPPPSRASQAWNYSKGCLLLLGLFAAFIGSVAMLEILWNALFEK